MDQEQIREKNIRVAVIITFIFGVIPQVIYLLISIAFMGFELAGGHDEITIVNEILRYILFDTSIHLESDMYYVVLLGFSILSVPYIVGLIATIYMKVKYTNNKYVNLLLVSEIATFIMFIVLLIITLYQCMACLTACGKMG